jgi:drug/metabolite transporter (DMT)-like permease
MPSSLQNPRYIFATLLGWFALLIWSSAASVAYYLKAIPPFLLTAYINLFAFSFNFLFILASKKQLFSLKSDSELTRPPFKDLTYTLFLLASNQYFFLTAFKYSAPEEVDLIIYLWPVLVLTLSPLFLGKKEFSWVYSLCATLSFTAIAWFLSDEKPFLKELELGHLFAFSSAFTWALYTLWIKKRPSLNRIVTAWAFALTTLIFFTLHALCESPYPLVFQEFIYLLLYGFCIQGLAYNLWSCGLTFGSYRALSLLSYFNPLLSINFLIFFGFAKYSISLAVTCLIIFLSSLIPFLLKMLQMSKEKKSTS